MDVIIIANSLQKIKSFLVFFCVASLLYGCIDPKSTITPVVEYQNDQAIGVSFKSEEDIKEFSLHQTSIPNVSILGNFSKKKGNITFTPVIPFSQAHEYSIAHKGKQIATFIVENEWDTKAPELLAIYPRRDTVPVNILKIYLEFSKPMQHVGSPLDFITVRDITTDIKVMPFLDLEAELWNKDHTRLTLWFDPGRIKTDLIPNKEKGLPLKENHSYSIHIDQRWKSANGIPLVSSYSKTIHVVGKDVKSPFPGNWTLAIPNKNSQSPVKIHFNETIDPILALESIRLFREDISVPGNFKLSNTDDVILFEPSHFWEVGDYTLLINPILEDLSGNNLQKLFDSDLKRSSPKRNIDNLIEFSIQ